MEILNANPDFCCRPTNLAQAAISFKTTDAGFLRVGTLVLFKSAANCRPRIRVCNLFMYTFCRPSFDPKEQDRIVRTQMVVERRVPATQN